MTPVRFRINLDLGPSAVYVPGQVVGGKVDLWLEKDVKIRGKFNDVDDIKAYLRILFNLRPNVCSD